MFQGFQILQMPIEYKINVHAYFVASLCHLTISTNFHDVPLQQQNT